jgi:hypothetical protein
VMGFIISNALNSEEARNADGFIIRGCALA